MADVADVVVIGGGVNGASAAWQLARRRAGKVVLLDKNGVGSGATSWSSGIVRLHYTLEPLARMAWYGREMFEAWADAVGGDCGFHRTGFLVLLADDEAEGGRAVVEMQRRIGIDARFIDTEEVGEIEPRLDLAGVAAGTYEPESGFADGLSTATAFADAARREGAEVRIGPVATAIVADGNGVTRVDTDRGPMEARTVVVAAGYRSAALLEPLSVELPITPIRHAIAVVGRTAAFRGLHPVISDRPSRAYYRPESADLTLLGEMDPLVGHEDHEVEAEPAPATADVTGLIGKFTRRFPKEQEAVLQRGYTGIYDCTPDFQPALGAVAAVPGLYVAAGFSGHGFKLGPAVGRILSDLVVDGETSLADVGLLRIERFAEGALIQPDVAYAGRSLA